MHLLLLVLVGLALQDPVLAVRAPRTWLRPIAAPVREATVRIDRATGLFRRVPSSTADGAKEIVYDNDCQHTYYVGGSDAGCQIAQLTGGVRAEVSAQDTELGSATIVGTGFPATTSPTALVFRANDQEPTLVVFGDVLRCVGVVNLVRLGATVASGGSSAHVLGHNPAFPPADFYYQIWFRNTPVSFCTKSGFNLSNGERMFWP